MQDVDPQFGARMGRLREQRGMSFRRLARASLTSKSLLHDIEHAAARPTRDTAQRIDDALEAGGDLVAVAYPPAPTVLPRQDFIGGVAGTGLMLASTRRLGPTDIDRLLQRTARLRRVDDFLGGADTFFMFEGDVGATLALLRGGSYTQDTGRRLLAVLAEQAQLAGWAAFDAGWHTRSRTLFEQSLSAGQDAGDTSLVGNAMAFMGYQEATLGRTAVDELTAACETADREATPVVRTLLHCRRAWAHAVEGQAAETEEHLDLALAALHEPSDRPEPDWVYWVDDLEHLIMTGRCWAMLGRPIRGIAALTEVMRRYDDTHARDKSLYLSFLAAAYLDANEVEQACEITHRAMDLSTGVASVRPRERILGVVRQLDPAGPQCVTDLRARAVEWVSQGRTLSSGPSPDMG